jgi:hypothetical protein
MISNFFTNYLSHYQSVSRTIRDAMWNQWQWMSTPYQLGVDMIDDFLVRAGRPDVAADSPELPAPKTEALKTEAPKTERPEPEQASPPEPLEQVAMKRMSGGYAPPREIYDVRNRGRINWADVPDWAKAVDPEIFEGAHEG